MFFDDDRPRFPFVTVPKLIDVSVFCASKRSDFSAHLIASLFAVPLSTGSISEIEQFHRKTSIRRETLTYFVSPNPMRTMKHSTFSLPVRLHLPLG